MFTKKEFAEIISIKLATNKQLNSNLWKIKFSDKVMVAPMTCPLPVVRQVSERQLFDWLYECYTAIDQSEVSMYSYLRLWENTDEVCNIDEITPAFVAKAVQFSKNSYKILEDGTTFRQHWSSGVFRIGKVKFEFYYVRDLNPYKGIYKEGIVVGVKDSKEPPVFYEGYCKDYAQMIERLRDIFGDITSINL